MHLADILKQQGPLFSIEFFPPKTEEASQELFSVIRQLTPLNPAYVSVTYGAGGTTRELTRELTQKIAKETSLTVVSHLTCVGTTRNEIDAILAGYQKNAIKNILALRGDPPKGSSGFVQPADGFHYAAELVAFIKSRYPAMGVGVAGFPEGHPDTPNRLHEIEFLKKKVDAGADYICTQLFFDNRDYFDFVQRCRLAEISVPIIPGIMPITTKKGMEKIASLALGSRIPASLLKKLSAAKDEGSFYKTGIEWATRQVDELLKNNVKGIHFYSLNKSGATLEICRNLKLIK